MAMRMKNEVTTSTNKTKVVFIMGATGTGKSKLSVDIATRFPAEIINSDKIQAYIGLDIVTNKLPEADRAGVPHHLLGFISDPNADFTPEQFRARTIDSAADIAARGKTPLIVGGSNSYLEALVDADFLAAFDCLFLWLDVELSELFGYVDERVDQMVAEGLVDEIRDFFDPRADLSRGIWRAIGVPEIGKCFSAAKEDQDALIAAAIAEMKSNTQSLVRRQTEKIRRLRDEARWDIMRIDATEVFEQRAVAAAKEAAWKEVVLGPSLKVVGEFLKEDDNGDDDDECNSDIKKTVDIQTNNNKASAADQYLSSSPIFVL